MIVCSHTINPLLLTHSYFLTLNSILGHTLYSHTCICQYTDMYVPVHICACVNAHTDTYDIKEK